MAYYGKLPVVLLAEQAAAREDSYNARIAAYLLRRMGESPGIDEIARECFVSRSAVSRFCRDIGLDDFSELRDLMASSDAVFERIGLGLSPREQGREVARLAAESMCLAADTLDCDALERLARALREAPRVACFGLLKAETAAIVLQSDLVMQGKNAFTKITCREQAAFLRSARPEDLIVIFSNRGLYFDYDLPRAADKNGPRLWIVTGAPDAEENLRRAGVRYEGLLTFSSRQDFASHPYQLMAVASILSQRAAEDGSGD